MPIELPEGWTVNSPEAETSLPDLPPERKVEESQLPELPPARKVEESQLPELPKGYSIKPERNFDNVIRDYAHIRRLRKVYDDPDMTDEDVLNAWISDGVARDQNSLVALKQYGEAAIAEDEELQDIAYAMESFTEMPSFWEEGGRDWWEAIYQNVGWAMLDPLTYAGAGAGSFVAKKLAQKSAQKFVQGGALEAAKSVARKQAAAKIGGAVVGDASANALIEVGQQGIQKEAGLRDEFDAGRIGVQAAIGAVGSLLPGAAWAGLTHFKAKAAPVKPSRVINQATGQEMTQAEIDQAFEIAATMREKVFGKGPNAWERTKEVLDTVRHADYWTQNIADKYLSVRKGVLGEALVDTEQFRKSVEHLMKRDPNLTHEKAVTMVKNHSNLKKYQANPVYRAMRTLQTLNQAFTASLYHGPIKKVRREGEAVYDSYDFIREPAEKWEEVTTVRGPDGKIKETTKRVDKPFDEEVPIGTAQTQKFTSAATSINKGKLPAVFPKLLKEGGFAPGSRNLDLGGGKFDNVAAELANHNVENTVIDVFNRSAEHNSAAVDKFMKEGADSVTISNVLNVIDSDSAINGVLRDAWTLTKPGGKLYVTVYEAGKAGGKQTGKDTYQRGMPLKDYVPFIEKNGWENVEIKNGVLRATRKEGKLDPTVPSDSPLPLGKNTSRLADGSIQTVTRRKVNVEDAKGKRAVSFVKMLEKARGSEDAPTPGGENGFFEFIMAVRERHFRANNKTPDGKPKKITNATDEQLLAWENIGRATPEYMEAAKILDDLNRADLQFMVDTNQISAEHMKRIIAKNVQDVTDTNPDGNLYYVPLFHKADDTPDSKGVLGPGKVGNLRGVSKDSVAADRNNLIANMLMNKAAIMKNGMINAAHLSTIDSLAQAGIRDMFMEKITGKAYKTEMIRMEGLMTDALTKKIRKEHGLGQGQVSTPAVEKEVAETLQELKDTMGNEALIFWGRKAKSGWEFGKHEGDGVQAVLREGKLELWRRVEGAHAFESKMLFDSLEAATMTNPMLNSMMGRSASALKRGFTEAVTSFPTFLVRNVWRDLEGSATFTQAGGLGHIPGYNFVKGVYLQRKGYKESDFTAEFLLSGGGHASMREAEGLQRSTGDAINRFLDPTMKKDNPVFGKWVGHAHYYATENGVARMLGKVHDAYNTYARNMSENAARATEFKAFRDRGADIETAGMMAADITTPFHLSGSSRALKALTSITPLLNPGIQGIYHVARRFHQQPIKVGTIVVGLLGGASVVNYIHNRESELYNQLTDEIIDINDVFPLDEDGIPTIISGKEEKSLWMMPKQRDVGIGIGSVMARLVEAGMDAAENGTFASWDTADQMLYHTLRIWADYMMVDLVPQIPRIGYEQMTNTQWPDRPIVPRTLSTLEPELQFNANTPGVYVAVGQKLGVSPLRVQHVFEGFTGTVGRDTIALVDRLDRLGDPERGTLPALRPAQFEIIKAFVPDLEAQTKAERDFFKLVEQTEPVAAAVSRTKRTGSYDLEYMLRNSDFVGEKMKINESMSIALRRMSDAAAYRDILIRDTKMSTEQKTEKLLKTKKTIRDNINRFMEPLYKDPKYRQMLQDDTVYTSTRDFFAKMLGSGGKGNDKIRINR